MGSIPEDSQRPDAIPELAHECLEALQDEGLPTMAGYLRVSQGKLAYRRVFRAEPINTAPFADAHSIRLDNGQVVWLQKSSERDNSQGYKPVRILDKSQRTEKAILSALTIMESRPIDVERMRSALHLVDDLLPETLKHLRQKLAVEFDAEWPDQTSTEDAEEFLVKLEQAWENEARAKKAYADLQPRSLRYLAELLRYCRPDLDRYSREDQLALLEQTAVRVNVLLEAMDKLTGFLEYGTPEGMPKAIGNTGKDVRAAELRDIEGLTYREIGTKLDISYKSDQKGDYPAVRKSVGRGRSVLERVFGREGWDELAKESREEHLWWRSLGSKEKFRELLAEEFGITTRDREEFIRALARGFAKMDDTVGMSERSWEEYLKVASRLFD